ncbi:MAG TPA: phosphatidylglycerophosphatase A [Candidatus Methylomirabilis sp.]|nr:phosphatidylglycerophosphatase A [Candidatus Methylomirabilis sp.]
MAKRSSAGPSKAEGRVGLPLRLLAAGAGTGYLPFLPGTAGSLLGAALCFPLLSLPEPVYLGTVILFTLMAVWAAGRMAAELDQADPPAVVIDEIAGMLWAGLALPPHAYDLAAAFLLFRVLDVVKPTPIPWLERLPAGLGIVADDVAAGLLARVAWWLLKVNFDFL